MVSRTCAHLFRGKIHTHTHQNVKSLYGACCLFGCQSSGWLADRLWLKRGLTKINLLLLLLSLSSSFFSFFTETNFLCCCSCHIFFCFIYSRLVKCKHVVFVVVVTLLPLFTNCSQALCAVDANVNVSKLFPNSVLCACFFFFCFVVLCYLSFFVFYIHTYYMHVRMLCGYVAVCVCIPQTVCCRLFICMFVTCLTNLQKKESSKMEIKHQTEEEAHRLR